MTLRVLGRTASINVRKVLWTCGELDLHFEHVESDARLLAKNPNRLVPVIQDGEFVMWESNAICRYLANRQPRNQLLPEEPEARGLVDAEGAFTEAGAALRQQVEDRTDALALAPWQALGEAGCDELRSLVRPLSKAIVDGGTFGLR